VGAVFALVVSIWDDDGMYTVSMRAERADKPSIVPDEIVDSEPIYESVL
jgi:hypothetical protein